jgi:hypothetical protein
MERRDVEEKINKEYYCSRADVCALHEKLFSVYIRETVTLGISCGLNKTRIKLQADYCERVTRYDNCAFERLIRWRMNFQDIVQQCTEQMTKQRNYESRYRCINTRSRYLSLSLSLFLFSGSHLRIFSNVEQRLASFETYEAPLRISGIQEKEENRTFVFL